MINLIAVHGAFQGGYVWKQMLRPMATLGIKLHAPTLKGLADRKSELTSHVGLHDHIDEICEYISTLPQQEPVVLLGHSYGSLVVTGVANKIPERLKGVIFLDSPIPSDSATKPQSLLDILGPDVAQYFMSLTKDGIVGTFPPAGFGLSETEHAEWIAQHTPQSLKCFTDKVATWYPKQEIPFPVAYIQCTPENPFTNSQARIAMDYRWPVFKIESGHCPMITRPGALIGLLQNEVLPLFGNSCAHREEDTASSKP
jgi:pimeloyl-ACP methyl ester carboxylesterase